MNPDKDQTWLPSWARAEIVFGWGAAPAELPPSFCPPCGCPAQLHKLARPADLPCRRRCRAAPRRREHFDEFNAYMAQNIEQHIRKPLGGEDDDFENMDEVRLGCSLVSELGLG